MRNANRLEQECSADGGPTTTVEPYRKPNADDFRRRNCRGRFCSSARVDGSPTTAIGPYKGRSNASKIAARARGFSLIELLIVVAIILIIAGIAVPNLIRSRMAANGASAAEGMRLIVTASSLYYETYSNGYPPNIASMGGPPGGVPTCNQAEELEPVLVNPPNQKSGYTFSYVGKNGNVNPTVGCAAQGFLGFLATAVPMSVGVTGARSFCTTEEGVTHYDSSGAAIASQAACDALPALQ